MKTKQLTIGALLSAMSLIIPLAFGGFLMVSIPPFTATIMSHVPLFLAMLVSPAAAVMVGVVSAFGFLIKLGPVIAARALMHAVVGYAGAAAVKKGYGFSSALLIALPFHALLEGIIVIPFFGFNLYKIFVVVTLGTAIHHIIDSVIALFIAKVLSKAGIKFNK